VRVPAFLAIIVLMVVLGGAVTLAIGERDAGGWLTGNEDGVEVLMAEKSAQAGPLTLNIHSVRLTAHFTRVEMSVENRSSESFVFSIFGYCKLTTDSDETLWGDPVRSEWPETVPSGKSVRGTVNFGRLSAGATRISVGFTTIFLLKVSSTTV